MSNEAGTIRAGSFPEGTTVSTDEARRCEHRVFAFCQPITGWVGREPNTPGAAFI